jgi:hypothetical protein
MWLANYEKNFMRMGHQPMSGASEIPMIWICKIFCFYSCHENLSCDTYVAMKLHKIIIASAVTATVCAGQTVSNATATADNGAYLEVSGLYNNFSDGIEAQGFRVDGGFDLGNGFSLDGRFENAYTDTVSGIFGPSGQELKFNELRALAHYTQEVSNGLSLVGGLGYGKLGLSYSSIDILSTEGLLTDVGVKYQSDRLSAGLTYTHLFAFHTATFSTGGEGLADEDIGLLEGSLGYQVNDNVAVTFSVQTQVLGNTEIEKELSATIGLRYSF